MDAFIDSVVDFCDVFVGHFGLDVHLEQVQDGRLELSLHEPELFVHLVPKDFAKDGDVVVFVGVVLDARHDVVRCL